MEYKEDKSRADADNNRVMFTICTLTHAGKMNNKRQGFSKPKIYRYNKLIRLDTMPKN